MAGVSIWSGLRDLIFDIPAASDIADLQAKLFLAEQHAVASQRGQERAERERQHWRTATEVATAERDQALAELSQLRGHPASTGFGPSSEGPKPEITTDTLANAYLRERVDHLEAEVEHYRSEAQQHAHRLDQLGESTTVVEYGADDFGVPR